MFLLFNIFKFYFIITKLTWGQSLNAVIVGYSSIPNLKRSIPVNDRVTTDCL